MENERGDQLVVFQCAPSLEQHRADGIIAARFRPLGLTAYGNEPGEAITALRSLGERFIRAHRGNGTLERVLNRSGVRWQPLQRPPERITG